MKSVETYQLVERLAELLRSDSRAVGSEFGLQPIQLEALHYLSLCNKYSDTPLAIADYLGQTKGSVSQTLKVLENKGFLVKFVDINDKRIQHLKLTSEGHKVLEKAIPSPLFGKLSEQLEQTEINEINQTLKYLITQLLKATPRKSFGLCSECRYHLKHNNGSFCGLLNEPLDLIDGTKICKEHESL